MYVGQLVAYSHEESGINVASILDETLPIIEIPTAVRLSCRLFFFWSIQHNQSGIKYYYCMTDSIYTNILYLKGEAYS